MRRRHYFAASSCGLMAALGSGCPEESKGTYVVDDDGDG
jgi:hypothetical protein